MTSLNEWFALTTFYGTDWAAMIFTFLQLMLLGNRNPLGFVFGICANVCWSAFGIMVGSVANPLANAVFLVLNVRGLLAWRRRPTPQDVSH